MDRLIIQSFSPKKWHYLRIYLRDSNIIFDNKLALWEKKKTRWKFSSVDCVSLACRVFFPYLGVSRVYMSGISSADSLYQPLTSSAWTRDRRSEGLAFLRKSALLSEHHFLSWQVESSVPLVLWRTSRGSWQVAPLQSYRIRATQTRVARARSRTSVFAVS